MTSRLLIAVAVALVVVWSLVGWLLVRNWRTRRPVMSAPYPIVTGLAVALDPNQTAVRRVDDEPSAFDKLVGVYGYQRPAYDRDGEPQRPVGYTGQHRRTDAVAAVAVEPQTPPLPHDGATVDWSPMQDQADASDDNLTPTGLLEFEPPAALDDGTVIGARNLPAWDALQTDTHHALDAAWEAMLAEFRANMDAIISALDPETAAAS